MEEPKEEVVVKKPMPHREPGGGFWVTGKQMGVAGIMAAGISVPQFFQWQELFTGEQKRRADRMEIMLTEIKGSITKLSDDTTTTVRRVYDLGNEAVAASENRCMDRTKELRQELRADISALQIFAFKQRDPKGS